MSERQFFKCLPSHPNDHSRSGKVVARPGKTSLRHVSNLIATSRLDMITHVAGAQKSSFEPDLGKMWGLDWGLPRTFLV